MAHSVQRYKKLGFSSLMPPVKKEFVARFKLKRRQSCGMHNVKLMNCCVAFGDRTVAVCEGGFLYVPFREAVSAGPPVGHLSPLPSELPIHLLTWNCFRGDAVVRAAALADLAPDVLVLQECAKPKAPQPGVHWLGGKPTQGVAVAVRSPFTAIAPPAADMDDQVAYPVRIEGPRSFNLLAVWTKPRPTYVASLWDALDRHADWLADGPSIVAGDFNSHARWDRNGRPNHSDLVARLRDEFGLVSAWHTVSVRDQGGEGGDEPATIFHRRNPTAPYHIDYVFVPIAWADDLLACWVPDEPAGSRSSDHRPLVVEIACDADGAG